MRTTPVTVYRMTFLLLFLVVVRPSRFDRLLMKSIVGTLLNFYMYICVATLTVDNKTKSLFFHRDFKWIYNNFIVSIIIIITIIIGWVGSTGLKGKRYFVCKRNSIFKKYMIRNKVGIIVRTRALF